MTEANLRLGAFAGTAMAYLRYRPSYPKALLDDLIERAALPKGGMLLDLACGPGRVALDLAASFSTVLAIDLEPEMIAVGSQEASRRGICGVNWLVGRAEDLDLPPSSLDLVTIGDAFHRLDQALIAERALGWLKPGGCLATLGTDDILRGREPWQKATAKVVRRWMRRVFPEGWASGRAGAELGPEGAAGVLRRSGFVEVTIRAFEEPRGWSFEQIVGYLQSTSVCSRNALGGDFAAFEADLRAELLGAPGINRYQEPFSCGYTLGRKPA
jgi:SAM-dependent methyltransferase